jgi:hypothetical protein
MLAPGAKLVITITIPYGHNVLSGTAPSRTAQGGQEVQAWSISRELLGHR